MVKQLILQQAKHDMNLLVRLPERLGLNVLYFGDRIASRMCLAISMQEHRSNMILWGSSSSTTLLFVNVRAILRFCLVAMLKQYGDT